MSEIIKHGLVYHAQLGIGKVEDLKDESAIVNFLFAAPSMIVEKSFLSPVIVPFEKHKDVTDLIFHSNTELIIDETMVPTPSFGRYMVFGMRPQNGGTELSGLGGVIVSKDDKDLAIFISENVGSVYKTAYVFDRILGITIHTWFFNEFKKGDDQ